MSRTIRNVVLFGVIAIGWAFFFVPNPLLSFLNVQQLQARLPNIVLFVLIPLALSLAFMFAAAGTLSARMILTLCVPVLGAASCLALWATGVYSDESLLGAWFYALPPILAYVVGIVIATLVLRRRQGPAGNTRTVTS